MTWQPIETAPLHEIVLGWNGEAVWLFVKWRDAREWTAIGDHRRSADPQPTHWMPFPAPPTVDS